MNKYFAISVVILGILLLTGYFIYPKIVMRYTKSSIESTFNLAINELKTASVERGELDSDLDSLNKLDSRITVAERHLTKHVNIGKVKMSDETFAYVIYCEHHSNAANINRVVIVFKDQVVSDTGEHLCTGLIGACRENVIINIDDLKEKLISK